MIMAALASINIPIIKKSRFSNSKITALLLVIEVKNSSIC
mgnify:FL=1